MRLITSILGSEVAMKKQTGTTFGYSGHNYQYFPIMSMEDGRWKIGAT